MVDGVQVRTGQSLSTALAAKRVPGKVPRHRRGVREGIVGVHENAPPPIEDPDEGLLLNLLCDLLAQGSREGGRQGDAREEDGDEAGAGVAVAFVVPELEVSGEGHATTTTSLATGVGMLTVFNAGGSVGGGSTYAFPIIMR